MARVVEQTQARADHAIPLELLRQEAFVGGRWISADASIAVRNPATGAIIGTVPDLGRGAAAEAVAAASSALPDWRARPAKDRAAALRRWLEAIVANTEDLETRLVAVAVPHGPR